MKHFLFMAVAFCAACLVFPCAGQAADSDKPSFATSIPKGSLRDPQGVLHTSTGQLTQPVVAIFSVPSMAQGGNQEKWSQRLAEDPKTKLPKSVGFYLIEDMKQTGFSEMARDRMKKEYGKGDRPILLLDETGAIGKEFGIPRNTTCILVYSRENRLVHSEMGPATDEAVARVRKKVAQLLN
jgi:hypothetical protein